MRRRSTDTQGAYVLQWPRWQAYQYVADGWIYPTSIRWEEYDPTQEPALPTELARLVQSYGPALRLSPFGPKSKAKPTSRRALRLSPVTTRHLPSGKDDATLPEFTGTDDAIK